MKVIYCVICFCFCLTSCHSQTKNKDVKDIEKSDLSLSLLFYPSMSIEDIRYSVDIINDSLTLKKYFIGVESTEVVFITNEQSAEIKKMTTALTQKYDRSDNWANGGWGCTLKVDNQIYYEDNHFSFIPRSKETGWEAPPKEIKLLIDFIVNLSPIPIELYGFS